MKVNTQDMRQKILNVVKKMPNAANDDKLLIALVWGQEGWDRSDGLYSNLSKVSSPETIRRTRQKLVQEGLIKPKTRITKGRLFEMEKVRRLL